MSIRARDWAWQQRLPASAKIVLLALAERADDDGHAWPSLSALATACGLARSTVERQLRRLEMLGLVRRERQQSQAGDWDHTHYHLDLGARCTDPERTEHPGVGAQSTQGGCTEHLGVGAQSTYGRCTEHLGWVHRAPTVGAQSTYGRCTEHLGVGAQRDTEPSDQPSTKPSDQPSGVLPPQRRRTTPTQTWGQFADQAAFTAAALREFGPILGETEVLEIIDQALAHTAARKSTRLDLYVRRTWLKREVERKELRNGRTHAPVRHPRLTLPSGPGPPSDLSNLDAPPGGWHDTS